MSIFDSPAKKSALLVFTLTSLLTPFMAASINIALPQIGEYFAIDAVLLSWVATSFLLTAAMFLVPFGRMADIYGRKKIFTIGILAYTLFSLACGLSTSVTMLIVFRVLQGIGSAMIFGTGIAILTSVFPADERGQVLGINVAAVYFGLSAGPFFGGLLTEHLGWRSVFYVNVPVGILIVLIVLWRLRGEWAEAKGERFDLFGSFIYCISLVLIMYGFSLLPNLPGFWFIAAGIAAVLLFVWWELRVESPVFNMNLFRKNSVFALSNLAALVNYAATYAVTFLLSLYLQYIKGFGAESAGIILVSRPIVMAVTSVFAGRLSDRIEPRVVASIGMALVTVGLVLLIPIGSSTSLGFIITALMILGLGFGLFSSPNMNAIMGSVERKYYGVASGTAGTMRLLGQMFSMGIATLLFAVYIGRVPITPSNHDVFLSSVRAAFVIFSALCFAGIFASLARGKLRGR
ncbi:MAG: MFS transporter [candidate division Zixibacteria bacterium]|nr:MFS transporter [candidate division Zixibacteria bacterium]MBU1469336.1 MFS transporter [candidate division Zixibacteria bacterium]MBU2626396.1 MFS transporter [candidate division Zixibacteria bacterium]